jgi:hypothetical protein
MTNYCSNPVLVICEVEVSSSSRQQQQQHVQLAVCCSTNGCCCKGYAWAQQH